VRGILFSFFTLYFSHFPLAQAQDQQPSQREFRFESEFGQKPPDIIENWDGGEGHLKLTLIESAEDLAEGNVLKLLGEVPANQKILFLNLTEKPKNPDEIAKLILEDERVRELPEGVATELQEELSNYREERADIVKKSSKHIAAIHFVSSLGAFTLISYLGEDLPHIAHWLVGFALAWECWLSQRYLIQINQFIYSVSDGLFKGSEWFLKKLGLENKMSQLAIDLEKAENIYLPTYKLFPKKLLVTALTFLYYGGAWGIFEYQEQWITAVFKDGGSPFDETFNIAGKVINWAFWGTVVKFTLLDLFSEGIPHWAVNNFARTSKLSYTEQAKFIYKWSAAISLFITCMTLGTELTQHVAFKWVAFPLATAGFGYFVFDGVLRQRWQNRKFVFSPKKENPAPKKKYSCLLRLNSG